MLIPQINTFQWFVDNFGATYTEAALGTSITAGGTAHVKNSTITSLMNGATVAFDVYGIAILLLNGFLAGASRRYLVDIFTDPAGGTAWGASPIINNLAANNVSITMGGKWYYFPLFIKAGTAIGARCQAETASVTIRVAARVFGKPSRPECMNVGQKVLTYGAVTASTSGTAMTPGASGAKGAYSASLATTADDIFWWDFCMLITDTSQTAVSYFNDVAIGDASNKILVLRDSMAVNVGTGEVAGAPPTHLNCQALVKTGAQVFIRSACSGTADSSVSGIAYGVAR